MEAVLSRFDTFCLVAADPSHASAGRLALQRMARDLQFDETRAGRLSIVATEAVTNMLRHGGGGTLAARCLESHGALGIEVLSIDRGPGMASFEDSARDGVSTGGSAGTGLGAMRRLSDEFEVYTHPGAGTIVRMVLWNRDTPPAREEIEVGGISLPKTGETLCGDAWAMTRHERGATFLVADGLGHGPDASRAAASAVDVLHRHPDHSPVQILRAAHARLRATRGAALAVMRYERAGREVAFAGVGNISASIREADASRAMVSHNGIVGHNMLKVEEYRYPWPAHAMLVAHSDGLESRWSLAAFPGIRDHHAAIVAAALVREHSRKRDDVTVLVARRMN